MVRFGLARYQPTARDDLWLSEPVNTWTQLAPWRRVRVRRSEEQRNELSIHVYGVGFTQKSIDLEGDQLAIAQRPHYEVRVMERMSGSESVHKIGPRPVLGVKGLGNNDACLDAVTDPDRAIHSIGERHRTGMRWRYDKVNVPEPENSEFQRYLLITEKTYYAADDPTSRLDSVLAAKEGATIKIELD